MCCSVTCWCVGRHPVAVVWSSGAGFRMGVYLAETVVAMRDSVTDFFSVPDAADATELSPSVGSTLPGDYVTVSDTSQDDFFAPVDGGGGGAWGADDGARAGTLPRLSINDRRSRRTSSSCVDSPPTRSSVVATR